MNFYLIREATPNQHCYQRRQHLCSFQWTECMHAQ